MPSPGRPGVNQLETKQAFWKCIAEGMENDAAALACGVSQPLGRDGFAKPVACRRLSWYLARIAIYHTRNVRRSRCCGRRITGFERSHEG